MRHRILYSAIILQAFIMAACASTQLKDEANNVTHLQKLVVKQLGDTYEIVVDSSDVPTYTVFRVLNPTRVVVDFAGYDIRALKNPRVLNSSLIREVRAEQFGKGPSGIGRMEIVLSQMSEFETEVNQNQLSIRLQPSVAQAISSSILF